MAKKQDILGATIDAGLRHWQILQRGPDNNASVQLSGHWKAPQPAKRKRVLVRVMNETTNEPVATRLDWTPATTRKNGTWSLTLSNIPAGGLYRVETCLNLDDGPVEWSARGDMVHHVGVGDVWLILGQSNAEGHGKTPVCDPPEPGTHTFHASGSWRMAAHPLGDSTGTRYPANRLGSNPSHSPWLAFARRLRAELGVPIGLIPASLGGSPLKQWNRKEIGDLFENMLRMVADAGGGVSGVVWYQGESDTGPEDRKTYLKRFRSFVTDLRKSLGVRSLPVITAQLNRYVGAETMTETGDGWEEMRETQRQAAKRIANVYIVSTLDLGLADGIHNDSSGNLTIGERMASVVLGALQDRDVKWQHPDCTSARLVRKNQVELTFANVQGRLHFENNLPGGIPFAVRDAEGEIAVTGWTLRGRDRMRLKLARTPGKRASVTGAPTGYPPMVVPFDVPGYRPMLAFTERIRTA